MKRILSLIFILLVLLVFLGVMFAGEMPKEVRSKSYKISLSSKNEVLYDGKLYTGKVKFDDVSYMNFKDGHLEGKTFIDGDKFKILSNIVNGELEGDCIVKGTLFGVNIDQLLTFKNGRIKTYKYSVGSNDYNLTFDANGNANGTFKDTRVGLSLNFKDGIAKAKNGFVSKLNTGDKGNEIILSIFDKNGNLIEEEGRGRLINREYFEKIWFPICFGEISDEKLNERIEKDKEKLENQK